MGVARDLDCVCARLAGSLAPVSGLLEPNVKRCWLTFKVAKRCVGDVRVVAKLADPLRSLQASHAMTLGELVQIRIDKFYSSDPAALTSTSLRSNV